jgi:hypothetical protein
MTAERSKPTRADQRNYHPRHLPLLRREANRFAIPLRGVMSKPSYCLALLDIELHFGQNTEHGVGRGPKNLCAVLARTTYKC